MKSVSRYTLVSAHALAHVQLDDILFFCSTDDFAHPLEIRKGISHDGFIFSDSDEQRRIEVHVPLEIGDLSLQLLQRQIPVQLPSVVSRFLR